MKKVGKLMEELGFNKEAPDSAKEAFIRHLIKVSTGATPPARDLTKSEITKAKEPEQMAFCFEETAPSKKAM